MKNHKITMAQQILNKTCSKADFTHNLHNDSKNRYIVSTKSLYVGKNPSLQYNLIQTIYDSINLHQFDSIGGWLNPKNNLYYLDCNLHFETIKIALMYAKAINEIAIFDQQTKTTIYLTDKI